MVLSIDLSARIQKGLQGFLIPYKSGIPQSGPPPAVLGIHIGTRSQEGVHGVSIT